MAPVLRDAVACDPLAAPRLRDLPWYPLLLQWTDRCVDAAHAAGRAQADPDEDLVPELVRRWVAPWVTDQLRATRWDRWCEPRTPPAAPDAGSGRRRARDGDDGDADADAAESTAGLGAADPVHDALGASWASGMGRGRRQGLGSGGGPAPATGEVTRVGALSFVRASGGDAADRSMMQDADAPRDGNSNALSLTHVAYEHSPAAGWAPPVPAASPIFSLPVLVADVLLHAHPDPAAPLPASAAALRGMLAAAAESLLAAASDLARRPSLAPADVPRAAQLHAPAEQPRPEPGSPFLNLACWRASLSAAAAANKQLRVVCAWRHLLAHAGDPVAAPEADPVAALGLTVDPAPRGLAPLLKSLPPAPPQAFSTHPDTRIPVAVLAKVCSPSCNHILL
jgi:hypothetical protein